MPPQHGAEAWVVITTLRDNPRNAGIGVLIMLCGVPVYLIRRRLFSRAHS